MEPTVRRIMKLGRIVDAHIHSFPEWENLIGISETTLRSGVTLLKALAQRNGRQWEYFNPNKDIAHVGLHQAVDLREILKNANTFAEAEEIAKLKYVQEMHEIFD